MNRKNYHDAKVMLRRGTYGIHDLEVARDANTIREAWKDTRYVLENAPITSAPANRRGAPLDDYSVREVYPHSQQTWTSYRSKDERVAEQHWRLRANLESVRANAAYDSELADLAEHEIWSRRINLFRAAIEACHNSHTPADVLEDIEALPLWHQTDDRAIRLAYAEVVLPAIVAVKERQQAVEELRGTIPSYWLDTLREAME